MATIGLTKTATIGKQETAATTEDGSGFYNVDTTSAAFTTTLDTATIVGEQLRFKQANGSWATNPWTLKSTLASGLKFLGTTGTVGTGVTTAAFSSKSIGEVIAEWDGSAWQVTTLQAALGGLYVTQAVTIATQNTLPALSNPWNGFGVPSIDINGATISNGSGVTFTSGSTAVSVTPATLGYNVNIGDAVTYAFNT